MKNRFKLNQVYNFSLHLHQSCLPWMISISTTNIFTLMKLLLNGLLITEIDPSIIENFLSSIKVMLFKDMLCSMMPMRWDKEWHQDMSRFLSKLMLVLSGVKSPKKTVQAEHKKDNLFSILIWTITMMSETVAKEKKFAWNAGNYLLWQSK